MSGREGCTSLQVSLDISTGLLVCAPICLLFSSSFVFVARPVCFVSPTLFPLSPFFFFLFPSSSFSAPNLSPAIPFSDGHTEVKHGGRPFVFLPTEGTRDGYQFTTHECRGLSCLSHESDCRAVAALLIFPFFSFSFFHFRFRSSSVTGYHGWLSAAGSRFFFYLFPYGEFLIQIYLLFPVSVHSLPVPLFSLHAGY